MRGIEVTLSHPLCRRGFPTLTDALPLGRTTSSGCAKRRSACACSLPHTLSHPLSVLSCTHPPSALSRTHPLSVLSLTHPLCTLSHSHPLPVLSLTLSALLAGQPARGARGSTTSPHARGRAVPYTHTHTHTHIYIYIYMYLSIYRPVRLSAIQSFYFRRVHSLLRTPSLQGRALTHPLSRCTLSH